MSQTAQPPAAKPAFAIDPAIVKSFCQFAGGFWTGATAWRAWTLTLGLASFLILSVGVTVALNHWNRWFFDALERRDASAMPMTIVVFVAIIAIMAAIGVGIVLTRETLQVRWRAWIIEHLVARWLGGRRFYHLNVSRTEPANPEYRIADDTRWATEPLVDLGIGLVSAVFGAAAFISILWTVGGSLAVPIGGGTVVVPAYMVIVALAYGGIASGLMLWVGRPLAGFFYGKNEAEGDFRFGLMRVRDNAESVALMSGEAGERVILGRIYDRVIHQWLAIVRQHGRLTWITNSSGPMKPIVPLLFAAPKYFSGELTLGQVTQLAAAFLEVQIAISWLVDNYNRIAEWYASARRVMDIHDACDRVDASLAGEPSRVNFEHGIEAGIRVAGLTIDDPRGAPLLRDVDLAVPPGWSVHIAGDTSIGKSTLVRAIAGLWIKGEGTITTAAGAKVMIVPQKPYMPLGSLRDAIRYPELALPIEPETMHRALTLAGLEPLTSHLDETERWDQRLSNGERQRLAVARILVHRPDVVILDDALSALDEEHEIALVGMLRRELPEATIVSLAQASPPPGVHDELVIMQRHGAAASLAKSASEKV